jgi:IS30 family transposase
VERQARYVMLVKVMGKDTETVVSALIEHARKLPQELYQSLTWDRGKEMSAHKRFTLATDIQVYFCDPRSPWQRGTNENTNGLLRQYFPKRMDLSNISEEQCSERLTDSTTVREKYWDIVHRTRYSLRQK